MQIFPSAAFVWLFYHCVCHRGALCSSKAPQEAAISWMVYSLSVKNQKKVGWRQTAHFCQACQPCSWHHRLGQNSSIHGHVLTTSNFFIYLWNILDHKCTIKNKQTNKNRREKCHQCVFYYCIPIDRVSLLCLRSPLKHKSILWIDSTIKITWLSPSRSWEALVGLFHRESLSSSCPVLAVSGGENETP